MFPTYSARKFLRKIDARYGHTEPWIVLCEGEEGFVEFVVKIFTEDHLIKKPRVHGEFAGTWFATEFELLTPKVAWIEFDQQFIFSLPSEITIGMDLDDDRLKFGSRLLSSFQHFSNGIPKKKLQRLIDLETLYAFDNFIRNPDRGFHKPNLLLQEDSAYLIDHEYALDINNHTIKQIKNFDIAEKFSTSHIVFPLLSKVKESTRKSYFDMFMEYLRSLNLNELELVLIEVGNKGYTAEIGVILEYFRFIKANPTIFVTALKRTLQ